MINLTPIPKKIQERMRQKINAVGRDTTYFPDTDSNQLTQDKMSTRSTFLKMVSGQEKPVILMGGELISGTIDFKGNPIYSLGGNRIAGGYDDIYTNRNTSEAKNNRPIPGVKSVSATFQGGLKAHREATINWVCWSFEDLDRLMPHFLAHGKTIMIQWGWVYDTSALTRIDSFVTSTNNIREDAFNSNHLEDVINNNGDYDMMTGVIKNFTFTARQDGGFDCETIITSVGINLLNSTEGTISSIDPFITYDLTKTVTYNKESEKTEYKIKQAKEQAYEDGEDSKLIRLNSTVSLKIFLKNIDNYIYKQLKENDYNSYEETKGYSQYTYDFKIGYKPNKYIHSFTVMSNDYMQAAKVTNQENVWVRWGWFEDNILSKFLSVTSTDGKVVSEFRSIERDLEPGSLIPRFVKNKNGKRVPSYSSTRIKSHPQMQTISLNDYILPGKFSPQEEIQSEVIAGEPYDFPGDRDELHALARVINEKFDHFDALEYKFTKQQNIRLQQEMGEDYKKKPEESQDAWKSRRKKYYESNITGGDYGYMRNMLINTKLIKKAFGIDSGGIESINIYESIESMFSLLNNKITYWDFKLVSDEVDTYRLKIIDNANTWIDFGKDSGLETFKSKFLRNNLVGKPGIFEFPVWKHNSIVKGQELQASIPTSMQLAAMYGSNTDTLKSFSKSSFQEVSGMAAGGLYNDKNDERNKGLDIAFLNPNTENLGTESGMANEKLSNKGDNIKEFILDESAQIDVKAGDKLTDVHEKIKAGTGGGNEILFDDSVPPPFFDALNRKQKLDLFKQIDKENPFGVRDIVQMNKEYAQLFSSKYDENGDMRKQYIGTISSLITFWSEDNTNDNRPIEMLFDLSLDIDGIGGIVPGNSFHSAYLPKTYKERCVFQATNVEHTIDNNTWTTSITGIMRSTIGYVFNDTSISERTRTQLKNVKANIAKKITEDTKPNPVLMVNLSPVGTGKFIDGQEIMDDSMVGKVVEVKTDREKYFENTMPAATLDVDALGLDILGDYSDIDLTQDTPEARAAFLARYNELNNTNYNDITEIPAVVSTVGP